MGIDFWNRRSHSVWWRAGCPASSGDALMDMTTYSMWQSDSKTATSEDIRRAIDSYIKRFGQPPNILETPLKDIPLPDGLNLRWINLPKNILLVGKVE